MKRGLSGSREFSPDSHAHENISENVRCDPREWHANCNSQQSNVAAWVRFTGERSRRECRAAMMFWPPLFYALIESGDFYCAALLAGCVAAAFFAFTASV
jgi:hypothetical protein